MEAKRSNNLPLRGQGRGRWKREGGGSAEERPEHEGPDRFPPFQELVTKKIQGEKGNAQGREDCGEGGDQYIFAGICAPISRDAVETAGEHSEPFTGKGISSFWEELGTVGKEK